MTLFLDGIFDKYGVGSPSSIIINYPIAGERGEGGRDYLNGLIVSEPTLSSSVRWGPILNDLSNLQDVASLLGSPHMWSWIGASVMCWKGTSPLTTNLEFYLINYKRGLNLEKKLKELNYLTSLIQIGDNKATVQVHGGYSAKVLAGSNEKYFDNNVKKNKKDNSRDFLGKVLEPFKKLADDENMEEGTLRIQIGNKILIKNMLITRLDVTPSIVEVPDGKALYYRVSISLTGSRPLLSTDIEQMFVGE